MVKCITTSRATCIQCIKIEHVLTLKLFKALIDQLLYYCWCLSQEEPLNHELRPGPVLMMTMNYLLNNIMDRGEKGIWADWFDFLWNRTRAIRKDITQQHIHDETAVELMEKCSRYSNIF